MHGDAFVMWDVDEMNQRVRNCIAQRRTCNNCQNAVARPRASDIASSANPPWRSTTVSPRTVTQNEAPTSAPPARFSSNATRTSGNCSFIGRP